MKAKSQLLMSLLISSCLISCTSINKSTALDDNLQANSKLKAGTNADLINADRPDQYYAMGRQYQSNGNHADAMIAYQKSLQLDPSYTKSMTGLATVFADQKLYNIAIPLFEQVTKLEPAAVNYNNLGYAYYLNQQYVEANRALTQAIMLAPDYLQAQKNLELLAQSQPVATSDLTQALHANSNPQGMESTALVKHNVVELNKLAPPDIPSQTAHVESGIAETKSAAKMLQTAGGVYELSVEPPSNGVANIEAAAPVNMPISQSNTAVHVAQNISASISGGIRFKHAPVMHKLFDLASHRLATFHVSHRNQFVEIINGNGLKGIARAVASRLQEAGDVQLKVADAKRFNQMQTHIQYKSGYRDSAVSLNNSLMNKPYLVRNDQLPNHVAIRLVLGRDLLRQPS